MRAPEVSITQIPEATLGDILGSVIATTIVEGENLVNTCYRHCKVARVRFKVNIGPVMSNRR